MKPLLLTVFICLSFSLFSQNLKNISGSGGPDTFGYTWIDSDDPEGLVFSWIDITSSGTEITGLVDDGVVGPFDIGFEFPFYGQSKSQFWINSNGCLSFNGSLLPFANETIPTGTTATDFIAWFWDDLNPSNTNTKVYFETFEDTILVVQFEKYAQYLQQSYFIDAEVILYESGKIKVQYLSIDPEFLMESETIGLQSYDNLMGLLVANNFPYVHEQLALVFDIDGNSSVGLDDNFVENQKMIAYPNPVQTEVSFIFPTGKNDRTLVITDLLGRIVLSVITENHRGQLDLNLGQLSPGIYSATLKSQENEKIFGLKFVVSR
ncbi:MAG: T9SS type A sorting domain-containing protein [Bacteroidetes bacterium]|nr:T9SS type A sorting domain-containing protein [Bacteroidota bacterium]